MTGLILSSLSLKMQSLSKSSGSASYPTLYRLRPKQHRPLGLLDAKTSHALAAWQACSASAASNCLAYHAPFQPSCRLCTKCPCFAFARLLRFPQFPSRYDVGRSFSVIPATTRVIMCYSSSMQSTRTWMPVTTTSRTHHSR